MYLTYYSFAAIVYLFQRIENMNFTEVVSLKRPFRFIWKAKDDLDIKTPWLIFNKGSCIEEITGRFFEVTASMIEVDDWESSPAVLELDAKKVSEAIIKACLKFDVERGADIAELATDLLEFNKVNFSDV